MTNKNHTALYTGVTNDLARRVWEHKNNVYTKSFTSRYKAHELVWYSCGEDINGAIAYEKQIKGGSRTDKVRLIQELNPAWNDLSGEIGVDKIQI